MYVFAHVFHLSCEGWVRKFYYNFVMFNGSYGKEGFMATRFRKSIKVAPGVKLNVNKNSVSLTAGVKGYHKTINSNGTVTTSAGIPGTGLSYVDTKTSKSHSSSAASPCGQTVDVGIGSVYVPGSVEEMEEMLASQPHYTKNNTVALILCVLLGYLGAHYFYTRRVGMGFLYLFTLGLFGIGWIVDIVRIAARHFKAGYNVTLE